VAREELAPAAVADPRDGGGRLDDVGHEDRREEAAPARRRDLSAGGAAIECSAQPLEVGDVVLVRLERHPDIGLEPMQLRAEVRNRRGDSDIYGLMWTRLTREQQSHLIQVTVELARLRKEFERLVAEQDRVTVRRPRR